MSEKLTRLDAARKQLVCAIRLFIDNRDSVSIYTLASNAWEIIDAFCVKRGVESFSMQARLNIADNKDLRRDYINSPWRNFFKHADRDPDLALDGFCDTFNDHVIYLAVEDWTRLFGGSPPEFQVFQLWYLGMYPAKIADHRLDEIMGYVDARFPKIREISRLEQKKLAKIALEEFLLDEDLMKDPRADLSEVSTWC